MGDEKHQAHPTPAPQAEHPFRCPACGRPVETVVQRHKSLAVFVPEWRPAPCRNPDCPQYVPEEAAAEQ
ncbi:hypothetical protein LG634_30700 [Streptomyces bambusae]|uniref:hypothetical protein n=1 Tax=Streptomyces bambusae TaxID=1550616 RepID=UPI001CFFDA91|nr:hypothetical protein [Streptomyces bambusae]MCB5169165.1 hypothetical protein [Streptomyces bambusae]